MQTSARRWTGPRLEETLLDAEWKVRLPIGDSARTAAMGLVVPAGPAQAAT